MLSWSDQGCFGCRLHLRDVCGGAQRVLADQHGRRRPMLRVPVQGEQLRHRARMLRGYTSSWDSLDCLVCIEQSAGVCNERAM